MLPQCKLAPRWRRACYRRAMLGEGTSLRQKSQMKKAVQKVKVMAMTRSQTTRMVRSGLSAEGFFLA